MNSLGGFLSNIIGSPRKSDATPARGVDTATRAGSSRASPSSPTSARSFRVTKSTRSTPMSSARKSKGRVNEVRATTGVLQEIANKSNASRRQSAPVLGKSPSTPRVRANARQSRKSTIPQATITEEEIDTDTLKESDTVFASQPEISLPQEDSQPTDNDDVILDTQAKSSNDDDDVEAAAADVVSSSLSTSQSRTPLKITKRSDPYDIPDAAEDDEDGDAKMTDEEEDEGDIFTFTKLLDYRWDGDEIEIKVDWHGSAASWEPETTLHRDAPDALFAYWRAQGGRPENPRDADLFDIFAIRDHKKNKARVLVEWTGFEEKTWEPRKVIEQTAPEVLEAYWDSIKPAPKKPASKKPAAPKRGRKARGQ